MGMLDVFRAPRFGRAGRAIMAMASPAGDGDGVPPSELPVERQLDFILGHGTERSIALTVGALFRCVTLISSTVAELIANSAHVVDFDRRRIDDQPTDLLHLIRSSPDDECSAYTMLDDLMMDLLLDGNAIMVVDRTDGRPYRLRRMIPATAQAKMVRSRLLYTGEVAGGMSRAGTESVDSKNIVHARWPDLSGRETAPTRGHRVGFAASPLVALSDDIRVSREIVRWITKFYESTGGTVKADHAILYQERLTKAEQKQAIKGVAQSALSRKPLVLFAGAKIESLKTLPQDAETSRLRDQEIENIGRVYGIPPPLMGLNTTQWGSGISELARLYWKFAGRPAMNRLLQPMNLRLLPKGQEFAVNEIEIMRGDMAALTALINATKGGSSSPIVSRTETRSMIGLDSPFPEDEEPDDADMAPPPGQGPDPAIAPDDAPDAPDAGGGPRDRRRDRDRDRSRD